MLPEAVPPTTEPRAARGCRTLSVWRRVELMVSYQMKCAFAPQPRDPRPRCSPRAESQRQHHSPWGPCHSLSQSGLAVRCKRVSSIPTPGCDNQTVSRPSQMPTCSLGSKAVPGGEPLPWRKENSVPQKAATFINCPKLETTQVSYKQSLEHSSWAFLSLIRRRAFYQ